MRTGDEEPSPEDVRKAMRDVIGHCIYGVDINPMAVELCKVALWMEALEPGKPLSFLDHHIQCGNSLLGATPALLKRGHPRRGLRADRGRRQGRLPRLSQAEPRRASRQADDVRPVREVRDHPPVERRPGAGPDRIHGRRFDRGLHAKEQAYREFKESTPYEFARLLADAWCAAFVIPKVFVPPFEPRVTLTESTFRKLENNPNVVSREVKAEIAKLADRYQFFHWHLAFLNVFQPKASEEIGDDEILGWDGGFDVVLGNPPWERIKIQEQEWFAQRRPDIAKRPERRRPPQDDPAARRGRPRLVSERSMDDRREAEGESHIVRDSGRFPLCGAGRRQHATRSSPRLNRQLIGPTGRVGMVVPPGIATTTQRSTSSSDLMRTRIARQLLQLRERGVPISRRSTTESKFCLLTLTGAEQASSRTRTSSSSAAASEHSTKPDRHFTLTADEIRLLNPNTGTCPIFRSKRDAEINKAIYRRVPVLIREGDARGEPVGHQLHDECSTWPTTRGLFRTRRATGGRRLDLDGNIFRRSDETYCPSTRRRWSTTSTTASAPTRARPNRQANQGKLPELDEAQHADPDCDQPAVVLGARAERSRNGSTGAGIAVGFSVGETSAATRTRGP